MYLIGTGFMLLNNLNILPKALAKVLINTKTPLDLRGILYIS